MDFNPFHAASKFGDWITDAGDTRNQQNAQNKLSQTIANRPDEQIPQAALDSYKLSKQLANSDMPGYNQAKQDIY